MNNVTINEDNPTLTSLVEQVNNSNQATTIAIENQKKAVLVSIEQWNAIQETLYLSSISGVKEDLIEGKNTKWEDCTPLEEVEW